MTSSPTNPDHLTVSSSLLAEVAHAGGQTLPELAHLATVIQHHPFAPEYWHRMGAAYCRLNEDDASLLPLSKDHKKTTAAFCFVRTFVLLRTVESSVKSFAKRSNDANKKAAKDAIEKLGLKPEEVDRIELFASLDVFNRGGGGGASGDEKADKGKEDFEDLGRSVRQKAIEESYREKGEEGLDEEMDAARALRNVDNFEKHWFMFIVE